MKLLKTNLIFVFFLIVLPEIVLNAQISELQFFVFNPRITEGYSGRNFQEIITVIREESPKLDRDYFHKLTSKKRTIKKMEKFLIGLNKIEKIKLDDFNARIVIKIKYSNKPDAVYLIAGHKRNSQIIYNEFMCERNVVKYKELLKFLPLRFR